MLYPSQLRKILIATAVGLLFGVPLGAVDRMLVALSLLAIAGIAIRYRWNLVVLACCVGVATGSIRSYHVLHAQSEYAVWYGRHSELLADIISQPQLKNGTLQVVIRAEGLAQKIAVRMAPSADPQFGQRVIVSGTIHAPQPFADQNGGSFDYPGYLRSKGITATESMPRTFLLGSVTRTPVYWLYRIGYHMQSVFAARITARYAQAQQPILQAVLFGDRREMSPADQEKFVRTGTIHLIAVSGFKLTILLLGLQAALQRFVSRRLLAFITVAVSALYAAAFSFDPPVLRAAVMSSLFMLGELSGGGYDALGTLVLVAGLMVFVNPAMELYDSSFLFSILGVLGIMLVGPWLRARFEKLSSRPILQCIFKFLAPAAGAYLLTLPLSLYWYGEISLIMPITVLGIMPLFEPCIILGYLSALPLVGGLAAVINEPLLRYVQWGVNHMAVIPFASLHLHILGIVAYATYGIAGLLYARSLLKKPPSFATIHALPTQKSYGKINNIHH